MRRFIFALILLFGSTSAFAGDRFEVMSNDDLIRSGLELELNYADVDDYTLAFKLTASRRGDSFTIPCRVLGSFVDNNNRREGYQRAQCQDVKYRDRDGDKYEVLTITLDKIWVKPTKNGRKSNAYKVSVDLVREYATRGDDIRKFRNEARVLFGSNFKNKTIEGAKTRLTSRTGRTIAESPIRLLNQIEQALTPVAQKGTLMFSEEVERSVRAWGFTYHLDEDYTASISGRWGSDGRAEAGVKQRLDLLNDNGYDIASKNTLRARTEEILKGTLKHL